MTILVDTRVNVRATGIHVNSGSLGSLCTMTLPGSLKVSATDQGELRKSILAERSNDEYIGRRKIDLVPRHFEQAWQIAGPWGC